jgi:glycosyltransferase involved in cell wall biosynthesis
VRLGIVTTHPVQYQAPWFRLLAKQPGVELTVFFCHLPDSRQQGAGFGVEFQWDVPLLEGYGHRLLRNVAANPSVAAFGGCDTPEIAAILREERFDAVIVNGWVVKSCLQTLWACRRQRVPCIVRGESNALRPRAWYKRLVHRALLRQYSAFLAIGKANRDFYLQNGVAESKIFMTPYGVDNAWFSAQAALHRGNRLALRRQWGIPEEALVFLFSGKLISKKRPQDVIRAMADAGGGLRKWHLLIAGDGELRAACERLAAQVGASATFAGFLNQGEMPKAYAAADCLVLPSDNGETWGLVVNEAMASGLPAIVSDQVGCHPDLVIPGKTGWVFPCGDVPGLRQCLECMDVERCRVMGQAAGVHVGAYSVETVVEGVREALASVGRSGTGR